MQQVPLGFDGLAEAEDGGEPTDYTVQFTPASETDTPKTEESGLLEPAGRGKEGSRSPTEEERVSNGSLALLAAWRKF